MKTFKCYTLVTLISILMGCGGGGESESKSVEPVAVVKDPPADNVVETTDDIIVDADFNLSTQFNLQLDAKLEGLDQRAYLNVCLAPRTGEKLDYNNCLFRSPLTASGINEAILISHSEMKLVAQIWFYDGSTVPIQYEWQYESNLDEQKFMIR
jgi:hypothetical protein